MTDDVVITVRDEHLTTLAQVADGLRAAGMRVDQVLGAAGVITGSVPPDRRAGVRRVPGVAAVEDDGTVRIAPPDADVQ